MASSSSTVRVDAQRTALLAAPTVESESDYYATLAAASSADVRVARVTHGKSLVAARAFKRGERVLLEAPLVGMQQETNRFDARVCGECFRYVGSVDGQIARRLLMPSMESACNANGVDREYLKKLQDGSERLPIATDAEFMLPGITKSTGGCDREVYCSPQCAESSWNSYEKFLSVGSKSESANGAASATNFIEHARDTNDIFILAAKVLLSVAVEADALRIKTSGNGKAEETESTLTSDLLLAWQPFQHGFKRIWWEAVARPEDVAEGLPETQFRDSMKEIAGESLDLLKKCTPNAFLSNYPGLFSLEVFASLIGMFELNNLEIAVASPIEDYFLKVDELGDSEITAITNPILDALDTRYCTPCEGSGFFALQSCLNSNCDPNVSPAKSDSDVDGKCVLIASRDIAKDEELTMCYVDETVDVETRRAELKDYGFICMCATCVAQSEGKGQARRGGKTK